MRRRGEFAAALRGSRARADGVVVHAGRAADRDAPKIGFIVSRAVGPAVTRNRVRRRLRHVSRPLVELLPAGSLVVIRALPGSAGRSSAQLAAAVSAGCQAVGLPGCP